MEPWSALLRRLRAEKFADLSGASLSGTLPISDRLLTEMIRPLLPASISQLDIRAGAGNLLLVAVRMRRPAWLPQIKLQLRIEGQPSLPDAPILVVRQLSYGALSALAGTAARFLDVLPPWLRVDGTLMFVDLAMLLRQQDALDLLTYVRRLEVTTLEGFVVVTTDARVP
jgi:hypothetical protein